MAQSSSDGIVIRYVLPALWMTSCFHTMGPVGRTGTTLSSSPAPVDVAAGWAWAIAAHSCLGRQAYCDVSWAGHLDSAASGTVMCVMSCALC